MKTPKANTKQDPNKRKQILTSSFSKWQDSTF